MLSASTPPNGFGGFPPQSATIPAASTAAPSASVYPRPSTFSYDAQMDAAANGVPPAAQVDHIVFQNEVEEEEDLDPGSIRWRDSGDPEKPYMCDKCELVFSRRHNLRSHYYSHTGNKPFKCSTCQLPFARQHDMRRHEKVHSGEKPHACTHCGKGFNRIDALTRHMRVPGSSAPCSGLSRSARQHTVQNAQAELSHIERARTAAQALAAAAAGESLASMAGTGTMSGRSTQSENTPASSAAASRKASSKRDVATPIRPPREATPAEEQEPTPLSANVGNDGLSYDEQPLASTAPPQYYPADPHALAYQGYLQAAAQGAMYGYPQAYFGGDPANAHVQFRLVPTMWDPRAFPVAPSGMEGPNMAYQPYPIVYPHYGSFQRQHPGEMGQYAPGTEEGGGGQGGARSAGRNQPSYSGEVQELRGGSFGYTEEGKTTAKAARPV